MENLDSKYRPWQTVFYYFSQFKQRGIWENILDVVVVNERKRQGKGDSPSLLAIDSQSVKKMQFVKEETNYFVYIICRIPIVEFILLSLFNSTSNLAFTTYKISVFTL